MKRHLTASIYNTKEYYFKAHVVLFSSFIRRCLFKINEFYILYIYGKGYMRRKLDERTYPLNDYLVTVTLWKHYWLHINGKSRWWFEMIPLNMVN